MNRSIRLGTRQRGVILMVALVFLLILSLLGVTAMQTTTLEERMAGDLRDQTLALESAEAALRAGETWVSTLTKQPATGVSCSSSCDTFVYAYGKVDVFSKSFWSGTGARSYSGTLSGVTTAPKYIVEYHSLGSEPDDADPAVQVIYRITARGTGSSSDSQVILQSTYITSPLTP